MEWGPKFRFGVFSKYQEIVKMLLCNYSDLLLFYSKNVPLHQSVFYFLFFIFLFFLLFYLLLEKITAIKLNNTWYICI